MSKGGGDSRLQCNEISQALEDSHVYEEIPDYIRCDSIKPRPEGKKSTSQKCASSQSLQNWRKNEQPSHKKDTYQSETIRRKMHTAGSASLDRNKTSILTRSRSRYSLNATKLFTKSPSLLCIKKKDISLPVNAACSEQTKVASKHIRKSKEELRKQYTHRPPPRVPGKTTVQEGETCSTGLPYKVLSTGQSFQVATKNRKTLAEKTVPKHVVERDAKQSPDEQTLVVNEPEKDLLALHEPGHTPPKSGDSNWPAKAEACIPSSIIGTSDQLLAQVDGSDSETYTPLIPMRRKKKKKKTDQLSCDYEALDHDKEVHSTM